MRQTIFIVKSPALTSASVLAPIDQSGPKCSNQNRGKKTKKKRIRITS